MNKNKKAAISDFFRVGKYFAPPGIAKRQLRPPPRGGEFRNPEVEPSGNYLD
tara:strand:- start:442 stop:597 length:156 start_codon:yes stop_codon:yes gene_type:complete